MRRLQGKIALVTGAARGIGEAIARSLVADGATCWLTDIDDARGTAVAAALGERARYLRLDVREEADWQRAMDDVLADCGASTCWSTTPESPASRPASSRTTRSTPRSTIGTRCTGTNLDGVFLGCKHAIRAMRRNAGGASIINISSRSGLVGIPRAAAYASSKAAVRNHTKIGRALLRGAGPADPLQLDPSRGDPDADVGADAGHRARARGANAPRSCATRRCSASARPTRSRPSPCCSPRTRRPT